MISLTDYSSYDGLGLAALVARKEVTAKELLDTALAAVAKVNPKLNAVLQTLPEMAAAEIAAHPPTGPFAGVPFVIKELVLHAKNVRLDSGCRLAQGTVPSADTELMARFRRAGLVLMGTTQTPGFGYNPTTETVLHGPVHNPWDLNRSAGGSSGGSGAAVAAGIVPVAHANDGGGSIRIPAACDGLVGLKPTRDRTPSGPDYADPLCGLAIEFAVTRTVRDAAALLDAVAGADVGAPGMLTPPARPYAKEVGAPTGKLRIAWTATPASGEKIDPECVKAVHETVRTLEDLGHTLIEGGPKYDWDAFLNNVHLIWAAFTALSVDSTAKALGRKPGPDNPRGGHARVLRGWEAHHGARSPLRHGTRQYAFAIGRRVFRNCRCAGDSHHRASAGAAGRTQSEQEGHDRDGVDTPGLHLLPVHAAVQLDRPAGDFASFICDACGTSDWRADRGTLWRRGDADSARRTTRAGASVGEAQTSRPC